MSFARHLLEQNHARRSFSRFGPSQVLQKTYVTCQSNASKNPGDPWNQAAPTGIGQIVSPFSDDITPKVNAFASNPDGLYGWILGDGCWYVVVSADGYETKTSPVFGTPPAVSDMDLELSPVVEDTTPPETTITAGPAEGSTTNSASATFEFTSSETPSTFECKLDTGDWETCTSPKNYPGLSDGSHTFMVRATDEAGNTDESPASRTWTVDTTPPNTTITAGPNGTTNLTVALFEFTSSEAPSTFECKLDSGDWEPCTSPKIYPGLSDGSHTFSVRATDAVGNTDLTPATRNWTVDTTAPNTTITAGPAEGSTTNSASATFEFTSSETPSTFECKLDTGDWETCTSPKNYPGLSHGSHTFMVRATDAVGNTDLSPASRTWIVDTAAPETTITSGPEEGSVIEETSALFGFTSSESGSSFACKLDAGDWGSCTSPKSYTGLSAGPHTFMVRATDVAGNTDSSPANRTFTVEEQGDDDPPNTQITKRPKNRVKAKTARFTFKSSEPNSTFECKLDGGDWKRCTSPKVYKKLNKGKHVFRVRAIDAEGNVDPTPARDTWRIVERNKKKN